MKKKRNIIIASVLLVVAFFSAGLVIYNALVDENTLSINEKKWIDNNSNLVSVAVPNDISVFGTAGDGVFFDFIDYAKKDANLKINTNMVSYLSVNSGYHFQITNNYERDALLLFKDHFVLASKNTGLINDTSVIPELGVAVINSTSEQVTSYFDVSADKFKGYDTYQAITDALNNGQISYALVPLNEYKDELDIQEPPS